MSYEYCYYSESACYSQCTKKYCKHKMYQDVYCCSDMPNDWIFWVSVFGAFCVIIVISYMLDLCIKRKKKQYQKLPVIETNELLTQQSVEPYSVLNSEIV
ncbi:Hypothetical_protein [Hexamita inflata]|uniref:Hypothetical_protein n=1 Tax=Hexamita inflata TaxID=28002 RepID=A0AA86PI11_9EUKA|nr:Hypothetical protein HINF_LOCUS25223 [Hexamita inflata]